MNNDVGSVSKVLLSIDRYCDTLPVIRTFTNLFDIFEKVILKLLSYSTTFSEGLEKIHYFKYIRDDKSFEYCCRLVINIFGTEIKFNDVPTNDSQNPIQPIQSSPKPIQPSSVQIPSLPPKLNDYEILDAISKNAEVITFLPEKFTEDKEFLLAAISKNAKVMKLLPEKFTQDNEFFLKAMKLVDRQMLQDPRFILEAITINPKVLELADYQLRDDPEFLLKAIDINPEAIDFVSDKMQKMCPPSQNISDKRTMLKKIIEEELILKKISGSFGFNIIRSIPENLKKDHKFISKAILANISVLDYINNDKNNKFIEVDKDFMLNLFNECEYHGFSKLFDRTKLEFKIDKEFIYEILKIKQERKIETRLDNGLSAKSFTKLFQDKDFALKAIELNPDNVREYCGYYKSETAELAKTDGRINLRLTMMNFVLDVFKIKAVKDFDILALLDLKEQDNKEFIIKLVKLRGLQLQYVTDRLKDDPECVLAAIDQNRNALKFASPRLQWRRKRAYTNNYYGESGVLIGPENPSFKAIRERLIGKINKLKNKDMRK